MNDIHSMIDEYVVGAVTPAEAHEFETHLPECASCTTELSELRHITARLSEVVAADPPPSLRADILAMIAATPQEPPLFVAGEPELTTAVSGVEKETGQPSTVAVPPSALPPTALPPTAVPPSAAGNAASGRHLAAVPTSTGQRVTPARHEQQPRRWSALLAAAAVVGAIGFGGWALQSRDAANDLSAQNERILEQNREFTDENEQILQQNQEFTDLLSAEDVRAVPGEFADGGTGAVVMSRSEGKALLVAANLPNPPADRVYQAWTIKGDPISAGVFSDAASGSVIDLPQAVFDAQSVAVTVEPAGGSERPTSDAVFSVTLPQT